ncbi:hypothetical protein QN375_03135 [Pseudomonas sp. MH9.2]|uniref:hypothetical protein n=1 Tax=Pseudomonas sp. MH9.2 TaxID=3048629 RepID=UPI002AC994F6|nr:hypothetical protein [Pseudomonas sp. MH9.2]MEB0024790.1 hypothetical protein [Pseudomonas sp. MH9.2]WPX70655.1 hypothetical protein RHM55_08910 [Pseudomonas sp. MH9.2]
MFLIHEQGRVGGDHREDGVVHHRFFTMTEPSFILLAHKVYAQEHDRAGNALWGLALPNDIEALDCQGADRTGWWVKRICVAALSDTNGSMELVTDVVIEIKKTSYIRSTSAPKNSYEFLTANGRVFYSDDKRPPGIPIPYVLYRDISAG